MINRFAFTSVFKICGVMLILSMLTGCASESFKEMLQEYTVSDSGFTGCWFCPLFSVLFDAINIVATGVANKLSNIFLMFMGIGILFFLAFKIGKTLVQLQEVNLLQFLEEIFHPLGRAMIAAVLLTFSLSIFQVLISPMLQLSLTLSDQLYQEAGVSEMGIVKIVRSGTGGKVNTSVSCQTVDMTTPNDDLALTPSVKTALICNLQQVSSSLLLGMTTGSFVIKLGLEAGFRGLPDLLICINGIVLALTFLAILFIYPTKLLDGFTRLAFVLALMPLWIVLWVFPATRQYTTKAWNMFLGTCVLFLSLSIVASFILLMLDRIAFPDDFWSALFADDAEKALASMPSGGVFLLLLIIVCIMGAKLLNTATILANTFTENVDLGGTAAGDRLIAQSVKMGGKGAVLGAKGAKKAGSAIAGAAAAKVNHFADIGRHIGFAKTPPPINKPVSETATYHEVDGSIQPPPHGDGIKNTFIDDKGQENTRHYKDGKLDHTDVTTEKFDDGKPKQQDIFDASGKKIGTRVFEDKNRDNYTQKNADGTKTVKKGNTTYHFHQDGHLSRRERVTTHYTLRKSIAPNWMKVKTTEVLDLDNKKVTYTNDAYDRTDGKLLYQEKQTTDTNDAGGTMYDDDIKLHSQPVLNLSQKPGVEKSYFKYDNKGLLSSKITWNADGTSLHRKYQYDLNDAGQGSFRYDDWVTQKGGNISVRHVEYKTRGNA